MMATQRPGVDRDGYATCEHCLWVGKARKDGTMRRHKPRTGSSISPLATADAVQDMDAPAACTGSGQPPYTFAIEETI